MSLVDVPATASEHPPTWKFGYPIYHAETRGPGTFLIEAELIGTWRHRRAGCGLQVELQPFTRLPKDRHRELEEQARAVGRARGVDDFDLTVVDAS